MQRIYFIEICAVAFCKPPDDGAPATFWRPAAPCTPDTFWGPAGFRRSNAACMTSDLDVPVGTRRPGRTGGPAGIAEAAVACVVAAVCRAGATCSPGDLCAPGEA